MNDKERSFIVSVLGRSVKDTIDLNKCLDYLELDRLAEKAANAPKPKKPVVEAVVVSPKKEKAPKKLFKKKAKKTKKK
jgi:hypothetical protein